MNVRILRPAQLDLAAGRDFYERQDTGAGVYYLESIRKDVLSLEGLAGIHRELFGFHRLIASRFPHAIFYRIAAGEVLVFRVLDCRRNPGWILKELKRTR